MRLSRGNLHMLMPYNYPTQEDLLDINFDSIVSDCRGIVRGTIVPRPWADISGTWSDGPRITHYSIMPGMNERTYYAPRKRVNTYVKKEKADWKKREPRIKLTERVKQMRSILIAGGKSPAEALKLAHEFLGE